MATCLLGAVACGGAPPPATSTPSAAANDGSPAATEVLASAPVGLDAVRLHVARPQRDLPIVGRLVGKPPVSDLLADAGRFLPAFVGDAAARAIDLAGPLDAAIGLDQPTAGAVSFRVRESEASLLKGRELGGRLRLAAAPGAQLGACELWRRGGLRLICGPSSAALDTFAPALAQVAPPSSSASFVVEASGPTYRQRLGKLLADQSKNAAASEDGAERTGREIASELLRHEKLTIEVGLVPEGVELSLALGYSSKRESALLQSWLEGSLTPKPLPVAPVAGAFSVAYAGSDVFAKLRDAALEAFIADLTETTDTTEQDRKDFRDVALKLTPTSGRFSFVSGADVSAAQAALDEKQPKVATAAQRRKLERALASWAVVTLDEPPSEYLATIQAALKLNQRDLKDKAGRPPQRPRATKSKLSQAAAVPKGLPPGSLHLLDTVTPNKDFVPAAGHPPQDAHVNHILIVPDAARARVLIAISRTDTVAAAQARAALDSAATPAPAPGPMLALRMTPSGLAGLAASFDSAEETGEARASLAGLLALPSKGQKQLEVAADIRRLTEADAGLELRLRARLSADAASEWLQWAAADMAKSSKL